MKKIIKKIIRKLPISSSLYNSYQEKYFDNAYRRRRELYFEKSVADPLAFNKDAHLERTKAKIKSRGYHVSPKEVGKIHTFAYIPSNWPHQNQIFSACSYFGEVTRFDYSILGYALEDLIVDFEKNDVRAMRRELGKKFVKSVKETHKVKPIDWVFAYALPWDMCPEAINEIHQEIGIPIVNISLDDKNWWDAIHRRDLTSGLKELVRFYDLTWTSASQVMPWHWVEGGQAIFLPEGVDSNHFRPMNDINQNIDVGFVGSNFGYRESYISALRKAKIKVVCRGAGWADGPLEDKDMLTFFNQSKINLGLGDMDFSRWLTNLKGRDFEIPSVGRGLYMTTFNCDLATNFRIGEEISCYRGIDEMVELIRYHLHNEDESQAMMTAARNRCIGEHQWHHRIESVLSGIGICAPRSVVLGGFD